ncbi:MAG: hypothetical protein OXF25_10765, partial [Cyanobacteria bacterium MAG CAR3_bin_5]|nr:hypothetical protein [Cyanobacteria bacterium MAG CAR4_bin_6]MCY4174513.1 hypothetical protein [Cyanobacteria bacterium MAG CAR3_bin_5]MCY4235603.1 hypothetical protein [Cyanobacteria bacterium MAG CAR2_bin_4]MCY4332698.1 hypothetical protein [Cyanobacteria bacterium MAG CAR1_bin_15]
FHMAGFVEGVRMDTHLHVKDPDDTSYLTPLTDFKLPPPERLRHGDIEQAYRLGRFGGVPNSRQFLVERNADQGEEKE